MLSFELHFFFFRAPSGWRINTVCRYFSNTLYNAVKSEVAFLAANWACCWIFLLTSFVLISPLGRPEALNKVFIHHMCPCINKHNKETKRDSNLATVRANPPLVQLGRSVLSGCFFFTLFFLPPTLSLSLSPPTASHWSELIKIQFISSACNTYATSSPFEFFLFFLFFFLHSQVSVLWWVLWNYQPTKAVWHRHESIYNHIQIKLTTSKQEQTA